MHNCALQGRRASFNLIIAEVPVDRRLGGRETTTPRTRTITTTPAAAAAAAGKEQGDKR